MSRPILEVRNLSKQYNLGTIGATSVKEEIERVWHRLRGTGNTRNTGEFWALRDVSFEVQPGEVVGIIGQNGAGKSTLLKILSRITQQTSGEIALRGRVASLLEVGTGFHPDLTGRENLFLNGAILGMTKGEIRKKLDAIVDFSGVEKFLDTPVKRYSSGMYVRLAFAVAAHLDPEILIVDEVLAVGDAEFQKKCLGKMKDVATAGRTVLFVSHNIQAVNALTDTALCLEKGRAAFRGPTIEVTNRYLMAGQDKALTYQNVTPSAEPKITSVRLNTSLDGNIHIHGEPFEIDLTVHIPAAISGACISIQIYNSSHINCAHLWAYDVDAPICRSAGFHQIKCKMPRFRLYMGQYRLRISFAEPPGGKLFERIEGICPFEVIMGSTRLYTWYPDECAYLEDYKWETRSLGAKMSTIEPNVPSAEVLV